MAQNIRVPISKLEAEQIRVPLSALGQETSEPEAPAQSPADRLYEHMQSEIQPFGPPREAARRAIGNLPISLGMGAGLLTGGASVPVQAAAIGGATGLGGLLRGDDIADAASTGGIAAGGAGVIGGLSRVIASRAVPLVRSAIKAPYAELRRRAGIEGVTPNAVADRQARFIIDNRLTQPEQARAIVRDSGSRIDEAVRRAEANPNQSPVLDTANRIPRYLGELLRRVERQIMPGRDRAAIQNAGREVVNDSPLSQSTYRPPPRETLEEGLARGTRTAMDIARRSGRPPISAEGSHQFTTAGGSFPQSSRPRALRANVRPSEGVSMMRAKSFFDKDASGGSVAAGKAIERAVRDSVKAAVPETRPLLARQGRAMDAERLLDRSNWLQGNRDQAGIEGVLGVTSGRAPLGLLMKLLKESQLRLGVNAPTAIPVGQGGVAPLASMLDALMRQRSTDR